MKLKRFEIALIFAVLAVFLCGFGVNHEAKALSAKLVRLHVVANSDSDADQEVKLRVRDAVLEELEPLLSGVSDAERAREIIGENTGKINSAAEKTLASQGFSYNVETTLCRESFPTTEYGTFSLPAGEYLSLRVKIGSAQGHNWWCVVFPPICGSGELDDATAAAIGLSEDDLKLITADSGGYVIRFKLMEIIANISSFLRGK